MSLKRVCVSHLPPMHCTSRKLVIRAVAPHRSRPSGLIFCMYIFHILLRNPPSVFVSQSTAATTMTLRAQVAAAVVRPQRPYPYNFLISHSQRDDKRAGTFHCKNLPSSSCPYTYPRSPQPSNIVRRTMFCNVSVVVAAPPGHPYITA